MNLDRIERIAEILEAAVNHKPYTFVPGDGEKAGAFGINYFNVVQAVLKIKHDMKRQHKLVKK